MTTTALIENNAVVLSQQQMTILIELFNTSPLTFLDATREFLRDTQGSDNPLVAALRDTEACDELSPEQLEAAADVVFGMSTLAALTYTLDNAEEDTPLHGTFHDTEIERDPACGNCHECENGCTKPN